jgi:hypothetical protein
VLYLCTCRPIVKEPPKRFAPNFGSVSGDGRNFRCCTVGELLRAWDCVSVMRVQEMCDEKDPGLDGGGDGGALIN